MMQLDIGLDLFPLLAGTLAALTCGLLGNFLVIRRLSLMGDAISHSVLPGLVIAFLITATRSPLVMFVGAAVAGVATVVLVELIKKLGRVEPGAAMGVVFSVLFALGVLLIEKAAVRHADLEADCVLHGQLEMLVWYNAPETWTGVLHWSTLEAVPRQVATLAVMCVLSFAFVAALFKELRIAAFDPALATTQGFNATVLHYLLMVFVAAATVASFEAVGSILVIAMLVCPAAAARLLTDRLLPQIACSVVIAIGCAVLGYIGATAVPSLFERESVNAAGSMALVAGGFVAIAVVASPRHGVIMRAVRRRTLARSVARDDLLATLYRADERGRSSLHVDSIRSTMAERPIDAVVRRAARRGLIVRDQEIVRLTARGRDAARELVRKHRLWEHYLVDRVGLSPDHVHATAEVLEHVAIRPRTGPSIDPHGRQIPDQAEEQPE